MTWVADNLIIGFEKYTVMFMIFDHEYHTLNVPYLFI